MHGFHAYDQQKFAETNPNATVPFQTKTKIPGRVFMDPQQLVGISVSIACQPFTVEFVNWSHWWLTEKLYTWSSSVDSATTSYSTSKVEFSRSSTSSLWMSNCSLIFFFKRPGRLQKSWLLYPYPLVLYS